MDQCFFENENGYENGNEMALKNHLLKNQADLDMLHISESLKIGLKETFFLFRIGQLWLCCMVLIH